jgi:dethiobiotin synthetase
MNSATTTKGFFVAGTDTGVGKTLAAQVLLTALAARGARALGMKPVASGCRHTAAGLRSDDAEALMAAANVAAPYAEVNPCALVASVSPHLAAHSDGVEIRLDAIVQAYAQLVERADWIVVEGAGGWLTPIAKRRTMADVAVTLGLPVVLVVGMRLGCLNHALLTQQAIAQSGLSCAGWIANCIDPAMERVDENLATLAQRFDAAPLAVFAHSAQPWSAPFVQQLAREVAIPE